MKNKLNPRGKQTVLAVLTLSIMLLVTTTLYLNAYLKSDAADEMVNNGGNILMTPQVFVAISLIILGVIAVIAVYLKKTIRNKNVNKLNKSFMEVFEDIEEYIGLSPLSFFEKKELKSEILVLFLEAQENGKTPDQVIGTDYNVFVDDMVLAYGARNNIMNDLLTGLQFYVVYLIIVTLLFFFEGQNSFYKIEIEYTVLFFFAIASFIIIPISFGGKRRALARKDNKNNFAYFIAVAAGIIIAIVFIVTMEILRSKFTHVTWIKGFLDEGMVIIKSPLHLIAILGIIPVVQVIKKVIRNKR